MLLFDMLFKTLSIYAYKQLFVCCFVWLWHLSLDRWI